MNILDLKLTGCGKTPVLITERHFRQSVDGRDKPGQAWTSPAMTQAVGGRHARACAKHPRRAVGTAIRILFRVGGRRID
jgi:hypothetical protein